MIEISKSSKDSFTCQSCNDRGGDNVDITVRDAYGFGSRITLCEQCAKNLKSLLVFKYGKK